MNRVIHASDVKLNFPEIKKVWAKMLEGYFDNGGNLKEKCVVHVICPYCGANDYYDEFIINGFKHVTCNSCETVYVTPRLRDQYIDELYSDEYYSELYINSMIPVFEKRKKLIGLRKFNQILEFSSGKGSVLDIGCGIGEVIDVFKDNEWDCHAIEVNPRAIKWLREKKINVFDGHFNNYEFDEEFDVVMAWGVVEHVVDPVMFLEKVCGLLKPGGVFVSEVPHGNSLLVDYCKETGKDPQRILMGEQHIVLYSILAYRELHENVGFRELHLQTNGLDFSTVAEINEAEIDETLVVQIQSLIDKKMYGDLLRGFWTK